MRSVCLAIGCLAGVLSAGPLAIAEPLENNFDYLYALSTDEEVRLGVVTPPEGAKSIDEHNGIALLSTPAQSFSEEEIVKIKRYLDKVPAKMAQTPPKAIVPASRQTRAYNDIPNAIATASGPYIFLGNRFFGDSVIYPQTENDRLHAFMHEYAHVLQYYHTPVDKDYRTPLGSRSHLVHVFSVLMGWEVRDDPDGVFVAGEEIAFKPGVKDREWRLPEIAKGGTSEYGGTKNSEDQADSFGFVIAGYPDRVSDDRVEWVLGFLGEPQNVFTNGVLPIHPQSSLIGRQPRGTRAIFQDQEPSGFERLANDPGSFYRILGESGIEFDDLLVYFSDTFSERKYATLNELNQQQTRYQVNYASGLFTYGGRQVFCQIVDFGKVTTGGNIYVRIVESAPN